MKIKKENLSKVTINDFLKLKTKDSSTKTKEYILEEVLNLDYSQLFLARERLLTKEELRTLKKYLKKSQKKPLQYCFNKATFLNDSYYVNKNVLIPRQETEYLVKRTDELIKKYLKDPISILEIGTGSGVIAISLKQLDRTREITATDISLKALQVALKNAKSKNISIRFLKRDILNNVAGKYDVLISNPPYIPYDSKNVTPEVRKNEPKKALYAKNSGLYFYQEILKEAKAKNILKKKNIIAFEIGENMNEPLEILTKKYFPAATIIKENDLNNWNRYFFILNL